MTRYRRKLIEPPSAQDRCYLYNDPDQIVVVVQAGPEQSVIRHKDGRTQIVCNSWLSAKS